MNSISLKNQPTRNVENSSGVGAPDANMISCSTVGITDNPHRVTRGVCACDCYGSARTPTVELYGAVGCVGRPMGRFNVNLPASGTYFTTAEYC